MKVECANCKMVFEESENRVIFSEIDKRLKNVIKKYILKENKNMFCENIESYSNSYKCPHCNMDRVEVYNPDLSWDSTTDMIKVYDPHLSGSFTAFTFCANIKKETK